MKQLRGKEVKKYFKEFPKRDKSIILILENIQYATNVANIFRTTESAGVERVISTGITKTPPFGKDLKKVSRSAENKVPHSYYNKTTEILPELKKEGYYVVAVELTDNAVMLDTLKEHLSIKDKVCFVVGNEDSGVNRTTLELCDVAVMIPMYGKNASLNVNVSAGIVLFSF